MRALHAQAVALANKNHDDQVAKVAELTAILNPYGNPSESSFFSEMSRELLEKKALEYGIRNNHLKRCLVSANNKSDDQVAASAAYRNRERQLREECVMLRAANERCRVRIESDAETLRRLTSSA